jgi:hypothetical protein
MEMIAMLNGLGATSPGFSPDGAAFATQINNAQTINALAVVVAAIDAAKESLRPDEISALKVIAMDKKDALLAPPFYKRPGYWFVVGLAVAAWYHRDKIMNLLDRGSLRGLSGGYKIVGNEMSGYRMEFANDGKLDYDAAFRECARINDVSRSNRAFRSSSAAKGACVMCGGSHPCTRSH